ncbi:ketopantoate reductase family protein [Algirhabdus cladophorae]|uniref:ketopantoate reductase family protein n=1 Tax=Algirhabdus cladophorae TaxID=3377108 RepID=UPI003B846CBA
MSDYHVAVFGGGSVGLSLATSFATAGARVSLLVRQSSIESLRQTPIEVTGLLGDYVVPPDQITLCDAAAPTEDVLNSDMLILTTKAYDVETALKSFAAVGACPPVLLLQNGMGSEDIARRILGPDIPIYSSAMMIGMERLGPAHVAVTAQSSPIFCGPLLGDDTGSILKLLQVAEAGFVPMALDDAIRDTILFKLLFNSCMNPSGAITRKSYGQLLETSHSRDLIIGLADETLAAFAAAYDYRPAENGKHYVDDVLSPIIFPRAVGHHSSMFQDLASGRKTEIDFLNGAICRLSQSVGLSAVRHESIVQLINACKPDSRLA